MAGDLDGLLDGDGLANTLDNDIDVADALLLQAGRDVLVDGINCQVGAEFERNLALAFDSSSKTPWWRRRFWRAVS